MLNWWVGGQSFVVRDGSGIVGEEKTDLVVIRIEGPTWYLRGS